LKRAIAVLLFAIKKCDRGLVFVKCDRRLMIFKNAIAVLLFIVERCDRGFVLCGGKERSRFCFLWWEMAIAVLLFMIGNAIAVLLFFKMRSWFCYL